MGVGLCWYSCVATERGRDDGLRSYTPESDWRGVWRGMGMGDDPWNWEGEEHSDALGVVLVAILRGMLRREAVRLSG